MVEIIIIINSNTIIIRLNIITIVGLKSAAPKEKGGQYKIPVVLLFLIHTNCQKLYFLEVREKSQFSGMKKC